MTSSLVELSFVSESVVSRELMGGSSATIHGIAVGDPRGQRSSGVYAIVGKELVEFREEGRSWRRDVIETYSQGSEPKPNYFPKWIIVGDGQGDGTDRIYVVADRDRGFLIDRELFE